MDLSLFGPLSSFVRKDSVGVVNGGYAIIRFIADNPGWWFFHCHVDFHAGIGMALVIKVGKIDKCAGETLH